MACVTRSGKCYQTPDQPKCRSKELSTKSKSARKRLNMCDHPKTELEEVTLLEEDMLEEIFKLSPFSPVKNYKEDIKPKQLTCKVLLTPFRDLGLASPPNRKCCSIKPVTTSVCENAIKGISCVTKSAGTENAMPQSQKESGKQDTPLKTLQYEKTTAENACSSPLKRAKLYENDVDCLTNSCKRNLKKVSCKNKVSQACCAMKSEPQKCQSPVRPALVPICNTINSSNNLDQGSPPKIRKAEKGSAFTKIKHALHSAVPNALIGRDAEMKEVTAFIENCVKCKKPSSLYISGAPGTGKTACLKNILCQSKIQRSLQKVVMINCMSIVSATSIYQRVALEMGATPQESKSARSSLKYVEKQVTTAGPMLLLVLDEIDQLDSKYQEVLYSMFGWTALPDSRIILIGIANSLDLTDRILPRLQACSNSKPKLLNFRPYNKDQLVGILKDRIRNAALEDGEENVIDPMAIQLCARKVAAVAGDARKALDVCRRAVEVFETSNKRAAEANRPTKVGMLQISNILRDVYDSANVGMQQPASDGDGHNDDCFPLQQKLVVCTLLLLCQTTSCKETTIGKLHEAYSTVCKKRQVSSVSQSEFVSLCELVESRGILALRKAKQNRQTKVKLNMQEKDVEFALQGKALLSAILREGLSS